MGRHTSGMSAPVHVLLVENERVHVRLLTEVCHYVERPCSLHVVADAREALLFLTGEGAPGQPLSPNVIFVNFRVDDAQRAMDAVVRIRERSELHAIPVFVLSAIDDPDELSWVNVFPNTRVLLKGYDLETFAQAIQDAMPPESEVSATESAT